MDNPVYIFAGLLYILVAQLCARYPSLIAGYDSVHEKGKANVALSNLKRIVAIRNVLIGTLLYPLRLSSPEPTVEHCLYTRHSTRNNGIIVGL